MIDSKNNLEFVMAGSFQKSLVFRQQQKTIDPILPRTLVYFSNEIREVQTLQCGICNFHDTNQCGILVLTQKHVLYSVCCFVAARNLDDITHTLPTFY